ncbi:outer membrane protein transport protein [Mesorhizobium sp. 8]|uniref:outer membrane protein transport protein n=1 Tax=Mesorhizobium sp. 8 TaxID=2584466 RepID=UPI0011225108|nr:outer membrane protein transport protein [Mesorhizobium sp. 8]QDB99193.1 aromatic hydrocarbon degradation protein [Mesorhizobium sp. 8]
MRTFKAKALLGAGSLTLALVGAAQAGGFSRGTADTDILFDAGNFNIRAGVTYVSPKREFSKAPAKKPTDVGDPQGLVGTSYTDDYIVPSMAIKMNLTDNLRCAATMVDNNGGSATYAVPKPSGKLSEEFTTNEKALTCGVKFQAGPGNIWILGGGFMENFDYSRQNALGTLPNGVALPNANLQLSGQDTGYRIGIAYEITDIALRAQLMYRSGTSYGADGSLTVPTAGVLGQQAKIAAAAGRFGDAGLLLGQAAKAAAAGLNTTVPATGTGNLPQSVEFKLQSGIAPGWLAFGSVKWMDWSVQKELLVNSALSNTADEYFWKDGWTVTGGVGHAFNDRVSGLVSLTWDSGVSTGYDFSSDTYTLALGGSLKDSLGGELRAGVGVSYLTSAEITKGGDTGFAVKDGYALAGSIGYNIKW